MLNLRSLVKFKRNTTFLKITANRKNIFSHCSWCFSSIENKNSVFNWSFLYVGVTLSRTWHQMDTRLWKCSNSGLIVYTSGHSWGHLKPSYDHRLSFSGFGNNFVSDGKIFGMPKKCPKTLRRFIIVLNSCVRFALRKAIVWASWQIVSSSSLLRVIIGAIWPFSPHEDNTMETRSFPIVLARQHDYVKPSQCRRVTIVL